MVPKFSVKLSREANRISVMIYSRNVPRPRCSKRLRHAITEAGIWPLDLAPLPPFGTGHEGEAGWVVKAKFNYQLVWATAIVSEGGTGQLTAANVNKIIGEAHGGIVYVWKSWHVNWWWTRELEINSDLEHPRWVKLATILHCFGGTVNWYNQKAL